MEKHIILRIVGQIPVYDLLFGSISENGFEAGNLSDFLHSALSDDVFEKVPFVFSDILGSQGYVAVKDLNDFLSLLYGRFTVTQAVLAPNMLDFTIDFDEPEKQA